MTIILFLNISVLISNFILLINGYTCGPVCIVGGVMGVLIIVTRVYIFIFKPNKGSYNIDIDEDENMLSAIFRLMDVEIIHWVISMGNIFYFMYYAY